MNKLTGQPHTIKKINSNLLYQLILEHGPISKPFLSEKSGLSLPTVNAIVDKFAADGEVRLKGLSNEKCVGRKPALYVVNGKFGNFLSLFFMGTGYICTVSDVAGKVIWREDSAIDITNGEIALKQTIEIINKLISHAEEDVKAIGIGVPGIVAKDGAVRSITSIQGWESLKISEIIKSETGIDTFAENDVKLMTAGYYYKNLKNLYHNIIYIFVGTGLGAGIILNGKLYTGIDGFAGEYAYMMPELPYNNSVSYSEQGGWFENDIHSLLDGKVDDESVLRMKMLFVTVNYISLLSPQAMVFGGKYASSALVEFISENVKTYIPKKYEPVYYHDQTNVSGIDGIFRLCFSNTANHARFRLIEEVGL